MSTRSDVGVAIKKEFLAEIEAKCGEFLADADEKVANDDGTLFVFRDVQWVKGANYQVDALYSALNAVSQDGYRVVGVCFDYPNDDTDNAGEWYDNPFCLRRSISLSFDE